MKHSALRNLVLLTALFIHCFALSAQVDGSLKKNSQNPLLNKYKDYEAVILADYGKIKFIDNHEGGFDYYFTRKTHYKINTSSGLDWTEIEIPLYVEKLDQETLEDVHVTVINPEDEKVIIYKKR